MRTSAAFVLLSTLALIARADVVRVGPTRGRAAAPIQWLDETGRTRNLSEFSGFPIIVLPIYTRCHGACVQSVDRLKDALTNSATDLRQFRVFLFSFDPDDNAERLAAYRQREHVPLAWTLGSASPANTETLLDSLGIPVGKAGSEFTHPNILVFLDAKLRVAKWIYGTDFSESAVDRALQIAAGQSDWLGRHSDLTYTLLVFAATLLCVVLFQQFLHRAPLARSAKSA